MTDITGVAGARDRGEGSEGVVRSPEREVGGGGLPCEGMSRPGAGMLEPVGRGLRPSESWPQKGQGAQGAAVRWVAPPARRQLGSGSPGQVIPASSLIHPGNMMGCHVQ